MHLPLDDAELEAHVSWLHHGMKCSKLHIHRENSTVDDVLGFSVNVCSVDHLVDLQLRLGVDHNILSPACLAEAVQQLLQCCQFLQRLHLVNASHAYTLGDAASIVVHEQQGARLTDLHLESFPCKELDFSRSPSLTSLELITVDSPGVTAAFELLLPPLMQTFVFTGSYLLKPTSKLFMKDCKHLTKLVLRTRIQYEAFSWHCHNELPVLPSTLLHLELDANDWIKQCDWHCLDACSNLERLTLPNRSYVSGDASSAQLKAWVAAARHLHVLDFRNKM